MRAARPAAGADETELPALEEERRINAVQESIPAVREGWRPCPTAPAGSGSQIPLSGVDPGSSPGSIPPADPAPWPGTGSRGIPRPAVPGRSPSSEDRDLVRDPASQTPNPGPALLPGDPIAHPTSSYRPPSQQGSCLALRTGTPAPDADPGYSNPGFGLHPLSPAWGAPGARGTGAEQLLRPAARFVVKGGAGRFSALCVIGPSNRETEACSAGLALPGQVRALPVL